MNGPSLIARRLMLAVRSLVVVAALALLPMSPAWGVIWNTSAVKDLSCAGTRAGSKLTCTAGEFTVSPVFSAEPGTPPFCTAGAAFSFRVDLGLSGTNTDRYDIGFFVGQTGNDPTANDASKQCSVATFPTSTSPLSSWEDDDGNTCGDYNGGGIETTRINEIKVVCAGDATGALNVPYVLTYKQNTGGTCTGPTDVTNGAPSKCNAGVSAVSGVVAVSAGAYVDITKQTNPDGDPQSFSYTATGPGGSKVVVVTGATLTPTTVTGGTYNPTIMSSATNSTTFSLTDGQTARVFINAIAASQNLQVDEATTSGWESTAAWSCAAVTGSPTLTTDGANRRVTAALNATNSAAACTITNTKLQPPVIAKSFSASPIQTNGTSQLRIVVSNPNATTTLAGVAFSDTYPTNLINRTPANAAISCTAGSTGTLTGGANGGSTVGMSGGSILGGGTCTITADVTSATNGTYNNSTSAVTSTTPGATTGNSSGASLVVGASLAAPSITKSFSITSLGVGSTSRLTLSILNPNNAALADVTVSDTYPSGLVNAATPNIANTCGGNTTTDIFGGTAGGNTFGLQGTNNDMTANQVCTVSIDVVSSSAGTYNNTTGTVSGGGLTGNTSSASVSYFRPTISKAFSPGTIASGGTSTLTVTLTNPSGVAMTGATFIDTFPTSPGNMTVATPLTTSNSCGGTLNDSGNGALAAGDAGIRLNTGTIPANGSCVITINVTATTTGNYTNTIAIGALTTTNGGSNAAATSASLFVPVPLTVAKSFAPTPVATNGDSLLTITLSNSNAVALTGAAFTDTYPVNLVNGPVPGAFSGCGGTVTAAAAGGSVALVGGTIPASGSCTVTVYVRSATTASYLNTIPIGGVTTTNGGSNTVAGSGTLVVQLMPPVIAKSFSPVSLGVGGISRLTLTITNPNNQAIANVRVADTYPSTNLKNAATTNITNTCGGNTTANGDIDGGVAGGSTFGLQGNNNDMTADQVCTVGIDVTSAVAGPYINTTGNVTTTSGGGGGLSGNTASATVTFVRPTITKAFSPTGIGINGTSALTITLANASAVAFTAATFTDVFPVGVTVASPLTTSNSCGGTLNNSGNTALVATDVGIRLNGGTIPASGNCVITVLVTSAAVGSYTNTLAIGALSTSGGTNAAATGSTLTVRNLPTIAKAFSPASIAAGGTSTMTFTLSNNNATAATGIAFTDTYPVGVVNSTPLTVGGTCAAVTTTAAAAGGTFNVTGGTIPGGAPGTCTITVVVTAASAGTYNNTTSGVTSVETGATAGPVSNTATLTVRNLPTIAKAFSPAAIGAGGTSTMTFTLSNNNATAATGIAFTDTYPVGVVNSTPLTVGGTCAAVTTTAAAAGGTFNVTGGTIPGGAPGTCTITVVVTAASAGTYNNTTSGVTSVETGATAGPVSNTATLTVNPPLTVVKSSSVISDPLNGGSAPKRIPGAVIEYTITVTNSGSVSALEVVISDAIPANTTYATGSLIAGGTAEDDDNAGADETDPNGGDFNLTEAGKVTLRIGTITAGSSSSGKFRVTIQ